ncbi:MAG: hypothetical protein KF718_33230 [Polyangiaceae bacterium]|nr:hypothetical protein [Polyangiaceae bacterium]
MSDHAEVFIDSADELEELSAAVREVLDIDVKAGQWAGREYLFLDPQEYEGDRSLPFEDYRFCLNIDGGGEPLRRRVLDCFEKLKATNRWRLMATYNLEEVLDRFEPAAAAE